MTKKTLTTDKIIGAAHWASYLINGDSSGLTDEEMVLARQWLERELLPFDDIVDCGEPYFSWHYALHTGDCRSKGGNVVEYTILRHAS